MEIGKAIQALIACVGEERFQEELEKIEAAPECREVGVTEVAKSVLADMGMPRHVKGWAAWVKAVELKVEDPEAKLVHHIYPGVAEDAGCTASCADKRMRHAVGWMWEHTSPETIARYFREVAQEPTARVPTVCEVLAVVVEEVEKRMKNAVVKE